MERFENLGIIKNELNVEAIKLKDFEEAISKMKGNRKWTKQEIVDLFFYMLPDFGHKETGRYLDAKM
ncbi:hypothetical protein D3C71_1493340 [compost metagenome]